MAALKSLVIVMGILIVFLFGLLVYGIYQKLQNPDFRFFSDSNTTKAQPSKTGGGDAPVSGIGPDGETMSFGDVSLDLPLGARVISANALGGKLVIVVARDGVNADLVAVVDLNTGQVLGRVKTHP